MDQMRIHSKRIILIIGILLILCISSSGIAHTIEPVRTTISKDTIANRSVYAIVRGYDSERKEVTVTLCDVETYTEEEVDKLKPGDTIVANGKTYPVKQVDRSDSEWIVINPGESDFQEGTVLLHYSEFGGYRLTEYYNEVWREILNMTFRIPDSFLFLDKIETAYTGDALELPTPYTEQEFFRMLMEDEFRFDIRNVYFIFNEESQPVAMVRYFVSWQ